MPTTPFPPHPPIAELLDAFRRGTSSPPELAEACLARIDAHDAAVNALPTRVARHEVIERAERLQRSIARGEPVGALAGMPYCAKDMHRTAGVRTTFGSPIFAGHVPAENDPVVQRLLDADAILVAKSNTPSSPPARRPSIRCSARRAIHSTCRAPSAAPRAAARLRSPAA